MERFPGFGERLREARTAAGLQSKDAAAMVGVSKQIWTDWEKGRRVVGDGRALLAIADLLSADPAWLLGLTDIRRPWPPEGGDRVPPGGAEGG